MKTTRQPLGLLALVLLALCALSLAAAPAMAQYREFTGKIDKINSKKMIVDNRMGDKVAFDKVGNTAVSGEGKEDWDSLSKGDWVTVSWKMMDKPRKAYKIEVRPPKDEEAEDM